MKYIIDIPEDTSYVNAVKVIGGDVVRCKTIRMDELNPYNPESKEDAWEMGYSAGFDHGHKAGADEAWGLAKNIADLGYEDLKETFDLSELDDVFLNNGLSEAKQKYEACLKSIEEIKIGDEVICNSPFENIDGIKGYVVNIKESPWGCDLEIRNWAGKYTLAKKYCRKTGCHNAKLAEVMKEITDENA